MVYDYMKKTLLTLIFCLSVVGVSFAQNNMEGMKLLTINAMLQYGQKLYDRGDFGNAYAVFNHVLTYDAHQPKALKYLKEMGFNQEQESAPVLVIPQNQVVKPVDVGDSESLKQAIDAKKQSIEKLRVQIMQMRADLAAQSMEK